MKTLAALLMMTSVAGASCWTHQSEPCVPDVLRKGSPWLAGTWKECQTDKDYWCRVLDSDKVVTVPKNKIGAGSPIYMEWDCGSGDKPPCQTTGAPVHEKSAVEKALEQIRKNTSEPCVNGLCGGCIDNPKPCLEAIGKAAPGLPAEALGHPNSYCDSLSDNKSILDCLKAKANAVNQSYTLVLRDKRGVTMLIRGVIGVNGIGWGVLQCGEVAHKLRSSPDIESAECFK